MKLAKFTLKRFENAGRSRFSSFLHSATAFGAGRILYILLAVMCLVACKKSGNPESVSYAPSGKEAVATTSSVTMKVLHYNVCGNVCWEASDAPSGGVDTRGSISPRMSRILTSIDNYQPDAITFNEICYSQYRNIRTSLISRGYGATYSSTTIGYQCDDYDDDWGTGYGNAVFFKGTVPNVQQNYILPTSLSGEERELLCTDVIVDGQPVKLCTTHITNHPTSRPIQIQAIATRAAAWINADTAVIITGDFNAEPANSEMTVMYSHSGGTGMFQEADESNACPSPLTFCRAGESTFGEVRNYYSPPYVTKKLDYIFFSAVHFGAPTGDAKSAFPTPISDHNLLQGSAILH